jgi:hypothetical protein
MASIRFPKIGAIIRLDDGTYSVGPISGIGGPFDSAADYFKAWAESAVYRHTDKFLRRCCPANIVEDLLSSTKDFPARLTTFAQHYHFQKGPFPLFHTDLLKSNVLIDSEYNIQAVIDWEGAVVVPWELVEFIKELTILPPLMSGPFHEDDEEWRENLEDRRKYVEVVREIEKVRRVDGKLSTTLSDWNTQNLASTIWLYGAGKMGLYSEIFKLFEENID